MPPTILGPETEGKKKKKDRSHQCNTSQIGQTTMVCEQPILSKMKIPTLVYQKRNPNTHKFIQH